MATDDRIRELLHAATPQPEVSIVVDDVRRRARRRSRVVTAAGAATVLLMVGGVATAGAVMDGWGRVQPPPAGSPDPAPDASGVTEDCPEPVDGLEIATTGLADFVFVNARQLDRVPDPGTVELGPVIARVTCTIAEQSPEHDRPAYAYWHEANAGQVPLDTPIREVPGHDPRCRVGVVVDGETRVYATELDRAGDCRPEAGTGCPESRLLPEGVSKLENWLDFVRWGGRTYHPRLGNVAGRPDVPIGEQIGIVTCNLKALAAELERDREVTGPALTGNASFLPVGTKLFAVNDFDHDCRIAAVVDGETREYLAAQVASDDPDPCALPPVDSEGTRVMVPSHCGVLSVTVDGRLWIADPALGEHNPPPGWDENQTAGRFVENGPGRAEFHGDRGQYATFRLAKPGEQDPGAGCE
jgi:hypothetical protein